MILLERNNDAVNGRQLILLFGAGLIGQSVLQTLQSSGDYICRFFPFHWDDPAKRKDEAESILAAVLRCLSQPGEVQEPVTPIALIWSAGKVGFNATGADAQRELQCFGNVLDIAERILDNSPASDLYFHLISSAGGLFEGQRMVDHHSTPRPKREYGELKLEEERLLRSLGRGTIGIYRPTSVFGFAGEGYRQGLIPTLIRNGLNNIISTIYGDFNTLRDYIFSADIGRFLKQKLFDRSSASVENSYFLCSGKPSSIYEIQHAIEQLIGKKIYLRCETRPEIENASDITLSSAAKPAGLNSTDLRTAICLVGERIRLGLACH